MRRRPQFLSVVLVLWMAPRGLDSRSGVAVAKDDPPATVVPVPRDGGWMDRHNEINARAKEGDVDLLFLGDSITQGWGPNAIWKKFYTDRKAMNAGIGGDRTQHVLWRLEHGNIEGLTPKLVVLMIGTNNAGSDSPEDIAAGIKAIVASLREKLPKTKILLLDVFPRGADAKDAARKTNDEVNRLVADIEDGDMLIHRDLGPKFLAADGTLSKDIMPDLLHLSEKGYQIWAEGIEDVVRQALGE